MICQVVLGQVVLLHVNRCWFWLVCRLSRASQTETSLSSGLVDGLSRGVFVFQALQHGFFDFETFDVDEYEHYEVKTFSRTS